MSNGGPAAHAQTTIMALLGSSSAAGSLCAVATRNIEPWAQLLPVAATALRRSGVEALELRLTGQVCLNFLGTLDGTHCRSECAHHAALASCAKTRFSLWVCHTAAPGLGGLALQQAARLGRARCCHMPAVAGLCATAGRNVLLLLLLLVVVVYKQSNFAATALGFF